MSNLQEGPTRITVDPSGQILVSIVLGVCGELGGVDYSGVKKVIVEIIVSKSP